MTVMNDSSSTYKFRLMVNTAKILVLPSEKQNKKYFVRISASITNL